MLRRRRKKGSEKEKEIKREESSFRDEEGVLHIRTQTLGDDEPDFFRRRRKGDKNSFSVFSPREKVLDPKEERPRHVLGEDDGRVTLVDQELLRQDLERVQTRRRRP